MMKQPAFAIEEWKIHETTLNLDVLAQTESAFALSNGHIGLRGDSLAFAPRLPEGITRIAFHMVFRNRRIGVDITATEVRYTLLEGEPLAVWHENENITLSTQEAVIRPTPRIQARPRPKQPPGRAPLKRAAHSISRGTPEPLHHNGQGGDAVDAYAGRASGKANQKVVP